MAGPRYTAGIGLTPVVRIHWRGQEIRDDVRIAREGAMEEVSREGANIAKAASPSMSEHISGEVTPGGARVVTDHKMAKGFEQGIPPHTIAPRRKKYMVNPEDGFGPVSGPVQHPGVRAQPHLRPALEWMKRHWKSAIQRHLSARGM